MQNFFDTLIDIVTYAFNFLVNVVTGIANLLTAVVGAVVLPNQIIGHVFAPLGACMLAVVSFSIIKLIVGRANL